MRLNFGAGMEAYGFVKGWYKRSMADGKFDVAEILDLGLEITEIFEFPLPIYFSDETVTKVADVLKAHNIEQPSGSSFNVRE